MNDLREVVEDNKGCFAGKFTGIQVKEIAKNESVFTTWKYVTFFGCSFPCICGCYCGYRCMKIVAVARIKKRS